MVLSLRKEFRVKNFGFQDVHIGRFCTFQWRLPGSIFLIYRIVIAIYVIVWLSLTANDSSGGFLGSLSWGAFLTNWTYILLTLYFTYYAVLTIIVYLARWRSPRNLFRRQQSSEHWQLFSEMSANGYEEVPSDGEVSAVTTHTRSPVPWYYAIVWILLNAASVGAIMIGCRSRKRDLEKCSVMGGSRFCQDTVSDTGKTNFTSRGKLDPSIFLCDEGLVNHYKTQRSATQVDASGQVPPKYFNDFDILKDLASDLLRLQNERMLLLKNKLVEMNVDPNQSASLPLHENVNANAVTKSDSKERNQSAKNSLNRQKANEFSLSERTDAENKASKPRKICWPKLDEVKPDKVVFAWDEPRKPGSATLTELKQLEKSIKQHRLSDQNSKKADLKEETNGDVKVNTEASRASKMSPSNNFTLARTKTNVSPGIDTEVNGPLAQNNPESLSQHSDSEKLDLADISNNKPKEPKLNIKENEMSDAYLIARSKTMPTLNRMKISPQKLGTNANEGERLRLAKEMAERATKYKKVFTIQGGYSTIRQSLRKRGWVEKFYKIPLTLKKSNSLQKEKKNSDDDDNNNDDNDDDDAAIDDDDDDDVDDMDNDQPKVPPWEEEDGIYGIMSRLVRNVNPTLFWVLKRDAIDYRFLTKDQMVNHYCKAGSFTTKVGLCINMRNVVWFDSTDHNTFFPRCYRLSHDEDKDAFVDDYRLTACMCIVKVAVRQTSSFPDHISEDEEEIKISDPPATKPGDDDKKKENENTKTEEVETSLNPMGMTNKKRKKTRAIIPVRVLETAVYQCEKFLASKDHEDIDMPIQTGVLTEQQWDDLIQWYYQLVHEEGSFINVPVDLVKQCESLTRRLAQHCPQFEMDGIRNVWIVKPGAKSRGRGIICYEKLEDMLKLVSSQVVKKDGKYVVQKYIERPLLIYNTKFDIRQWFLVTDWNPLTLWFYRDSYLRFCSQQFTLEDFDQSIHLSNNAIQKHYKNGPRSPRLPDENMWTHYEFKDYLKSKKQPNAWDELIYPSMKKAIICSLLVTQDLVEYRKSSFELYGADFMLTEDLSPWLIEINSSPSMESSTAVTAKLCAAVLDDTIKVVIDRKLDRNCDIGAFELAYKQALVTVPPYIGINLCVEGQSVRKPGTFTKPQPKQSDPNLADSLFTPRAVTMRQTMADRTLEVKRSTVAGDSSPIRNDKSKNFEAATSKLQQAGLSKEIPAKISTFRASGDLEKLKANKVTTASPQNTSSAESKWNSGNDILMFGALSTNVPPKSVESQKTESDSSLVHLDSQDYISRLEAVGSLHTSPGILPNTQYLAGLTQRRFVSKKSVSMNYPIPSVPGVDKDNQPKYVNVSNVETTDLKNSKPLKGNTNLVAFPPGIMLRKKHRKPVSRLLERTLQYNPSESSNFHLPRVSNTGFSVEEGKKDVKIPSIPSMKYIRRSSDNMNNLSYIAIVGSRGTNISGSTWLRACLLCGRGGGLQLDSADPNCRCQQDSILVTSHTFSQEPLMISSLNLQPSKSKPNTRSKLKSSTLRNSVTPTQPPASDDENTSQNISFKSLRPSSAHTEVSTTNIKQRTSRGKSTKKRKSMSTSASAQTGEPMSLYTQPYNFKLHTSLIRAQELYQGHSFSYTSGNWQNVVFHKPQPYISPPSYAMPYSVHAGFNTGLPLAGLRSAVGVRSTSSHPMVKIWPQLSSHDASLLMNPLGAMGHRRIQLNVKNSKGVIL
ncbi:protein monoglycylase TTLL8 isoform X2 [Biomphalaria glabrata]|nr:protein monoglycylase TTLL8 isoform X2 [Biomphalaria glabrata]